MAYLENIPQPSDQIASSQPEILGNFQYIQSTMQVDHAWDGSGISPSIDGTHQTLSMPNQSTDITSLGSTGCALIEYALGGNLFTWNGVKNPVSGISSSGTGFVINTTPAAILTPPANSIGIIMFSVASGNTLQYFPFYSTPNTPNNNVYVQPNPIPIPGGMIGIRSVAGVIYVFLMSGSLTTNYKYIYWPI